MIVGAGICQSMERFVSKAREAQMLYGVTRIEIDADHDEDLEQVFIYGEVNGDVLITDTFPFPAESWSERFGDYIIHRFSVRLEEASR